MLHLNSRTLLLVVGVLFHVFYLWSIFDIYFVSPLVHGMRPHRAIAEGAEPPAKRLFLIVGDGLRADTTFDVIEHPVTGARAHLAPFLRDIVLHNGTYGVSHTRMPTESRPGHVAMIAGFYEDVSAVTKGWKENPVDFDSVLNQSRHTFAFGSPDILPMFSAGASDPHRIDTWMYGHEFEDFTSSSIELDAFVFRHFNELLANSTRNSSLHRLLHQDQTVFFLHLLGCDTAGHGYRPYSAEYYDNVAYIDAQIQQLVATVRDFYQDDASAFIFTADHGMSAFGSHGDGHPNNTRTPLIAWGAGVSTPVYNEHPVFDNYTASWNLSAVRRNDVKQADIASLMAYLIGANYPVNSVGELPLSYIASDHKTKLQALYANALSILEQYLTKAAEMRAKHFLFREYAGFVAKPVAQFQREIEHYLAGALDEPRFAHAVQLVESFMRLSLDGLYYLTTYNWLLLRTIVTLGFVGWIAYSFTIFLKLFILHTEIPARTSVLNYSVCGLVGLVMNFLLFYQKSPFNYYMYLVFPIFFWNQIFTKSRLLQAGVSQLLDGVSARGIVGVVLAVVLTNEGIVYGFFQRWIFSLMLLVLGAYPVFLTGKLDLCWLATCACMSSYTLFDAVKIESLAMINVSGGLIALFSLACYFWLLRRVVLDRYTKSLLLVQINLVLVNLVVLNNSITSLQQRKGLPASCQYLSWGIFAVSVLVLPLLHALRPNNDYRIRMFEIFLTFAPIFQILTISFESFFYLNFSVLLLQWIAMETSNKSKTHIQLIRVSLIGFFFLQLCFFSTGNVSSISSFSLDSVYRLLPIFDPFPMGALLMVKLIIPYLLLSAALGVLNLKLGIKKFTISTLIISTSDILSLNFFYLLKTEGSWLDIGVTISNYCLAILSSLFMLVLELGSGLLLRHITISESKLKEQ